MTWLVLLVPAALLLWFIVLYNGLVRGRNEARSAWSQIDVQLKRRHDLVPNLVAAVKGYAGHERGVLEKVAEARAAAMRAQGPAAAGAAEAALAAALGRILALAEAYPQLRASDNFRALQEELASTENRLAFARQAYNDAAMSYNVKRETFPANLISGGFPRAEFFQLESAAERAAPRAGF